jgi:malate synthase
MADFEDATRPPGTISFRGTSICADAIERTLSLTTPEKEYKLDEQTAVLFMSVRAAGISR